jgi:septal ring factor EnvC (AmiA/AmiB activator)
MASQRKEIEMKSDALKEYEKKQAEIKKLLKQIEAGLEKHDHEASMSGVHHWGHVGDLASIAETLNDLKDRLHGTGEYKAATKRGMVYSRNGKPVKVVVP